MIIVVAVAFIPSVRPTIIRRYSSVRPSEVAAQQQVVKSGTKIGHYLGSGRSGGSSSWDQDQEEDGGAG